MSIEIKFTNASQIMAALDAKVKNIEKTLESTATGMGNLAVNEIKPLCHVRTGNWRDSVHAEVKSLGPMRYELWVGSRGDFNGSGYNYGAKQEALNHPVAMGWQAAQGEMRELYQKNITAGLQGKSITRPVSGPDEFAGMTGI